MTIIRYFRSKWHVPFWSCLSLSLCLFPLTQRMTTTTTAFVGDEWVRLRIASARQVQEKRRLFKSNLMRIQSQFDANASPIVWSAVYVLLLSVSCFLWATVAEADHAWTNKLFRSNGDDISNTIEKERNQIIGLEEKCLVHSNIRSILCPAKMTVNNNKKKNNNNGSERNSSALRRPIISQANLCALPQWRTDFGWNHSRAKKGRKKKIRK